MKVGKTNIEVNSRVVLVQAKEEKYLGATGILLQPRQKESIGCLLLENPEKYGVHEHVLPLLPSEKVIEIPEDGGKIMAGKTDIPINERVMLLAKGEKHPFYGYITHPFASCKINNAYEYIAGIRIESPKGVYVNDICNAVDGDLLIRYPVSASMKSTEDFYAESVKMVQEEKFTDTARIYCGWDAVGICVELDYEYHGWQSVFSTDLLFGEWYAHGKPSLDVFKEALGLAKYARAKYNLPLVVHAGDNYEGYLVDVEKEKMTDTAQVSCIWDEDGIFVDLYYKTHEPGADANAVECFYSLCADHEERSSIDEVPSEKLWEYALKVAGFIKEKYNIPLKIDRSVTRKPETGYFKDKEVFQNSMDDICYQTESGDSYTHRQILELCNNQEDIAKVVFDGCDWENPSTYLDQAFTFGMIEHCENCGKFFVTGEEQEDEIFCPEWRNVCVDTPEGILVVEKKGIRDEYPGVYISLKGKDTLFAMVEYDTLKECFQVVVYNDKETDEEPTDIIELRDLK